MLPMPNAARLVKAANSTPSQRSPSPCESTSYSYPNDTRSYHDGFNLGGS